MSDGTTTIAQVADVVDRAAFDASFRQQLIASPADALQSAGVAIPSGMSVQVLENTSSVVNLVLPQRPSGVSDADLQQSTTSSGSAISTVADKLDAWSRLVVSVWTDAGLKSQLLQDANSVLAGRGIAMPSGMTVKVVEASASVLYLVIPPAGGFS